MRLLDLRRTAALTAIGIGALLAVAPAAEAGTYLQTNLVSDIPGLATLTDPALINPWGLSASATSPFWVSDQGTNLSTLYSVNSSGVVAKPALEVTIPTTSGGPQGPTGQVNNPTGASFQVNGARSSFIFANLNGTISAWSGSLGTVAQITATTPGAVYTGLAVDAATTRLFAANTAQNRIDVFDGSFAPLTLSGGFVDPTLPASLVVFNVQNIGGSIYVTYAPAGRAAQIGAAKGEGVVAVFDTDGNFIKELITGGELAAPWGLALAPAAFGAFGGDLLVGNFSFAFSEINAFDAVTGAFEGTIPVSAGIGHTPGGLWGMIFGNGGNGGDPNTLYFANGIDGETHGLFAAISSVPEPASLWLLAAGLGALALHKRRGTVS